MIYQTPQCNIISWAFLHTVRQSLSSKTSSDFLYIFLILIYFDNKKWEIRCLRNQFEQYSLIEGLLKVYYPNTPNTQGIFGLFKENGYENVF